MVWKNGGYFQQCPTNVTLPNVKRPCGYARILGKQPLTRAIRKQPGVLSAARTSFVLTCHFSACHQRCCFSGLWVQRLKRKAGCRGAVWTPTPAVLGHSRKPNLPTWLGCCGLRGRLWKGSAKPQGRHAWEVCDGYEYASILIQLAGLSCLDRMAFPCLSPGLFALRTP